MAGPGDDHSLRWPKAPCENDYPKGDPENPLSERELTAKFRDLTKEAISPVKADTIIDRAMNLESLGDVNELLT